MSVVGDFPVRVVGVEQLGNRGRLLAVVNEVESLLARLADSGACGSIDLRSMPMAPADRDGLRGIFAEGEVSAVIRALGETEVYESIVRGVWWVTHRSEDGRIAAEFIEVTHMPEILKTPPDDVADGLEVLHEQLAALDGERHRA
ncbi:MAG: hypothetical protein M0Z84_14960 [Gammaproteobacteria bacterium]|nr:hypothetical protein [Gammaproteobacteria bacterium]